MKNKNIKVTKILNEMDNLSKILIVLMLVTVGYLVYNYFSNKTVPIENNNSSYLEISKDFSLNIQDHVFEHYSKDRYNDDFILNIFLKKPISQEDFNKLEIKILPEQPIKTTLFSENLIQVYYEQEAPTDGKENIILFLLNGKQVGRVSYTNLETKNNDGENLRPVQKYIKDK